MIFSFSSAVVSFSSAVVSFSCNAARRRQREDAALAPVFWRVRRTLCRLLAVSLALTFSVSLLDAHEARVVNRAQHAIGDSSADNASHDGVEPASIVQLAFVKSPALFVKVAVKVERRDVYVGSTDHPLDERPEVFEAVGVNAAHDVLDGVIDESVNVPLRDVGVARAAVGADHGIAWT